MWMKKSAPGLALAMLTAVVVSAQAPNFSGTWIADSNSSLKWILTQKDGSIHVQEVNGDKTEADFTCPLTGQECSIKEDGRSEKIMIYFNGEKLVEIRERGSEAVKQRLTVSADGKVLTVETVPFSSTQKAEAISFRRQAS
jgi:hypothetical protein